MVKPIAVSHSIEAGEEAVLFLLSHNWTRTPQADPHKQRAASCYGRYPVATFCLRKSRGVFSKHDFSVYTELTGVVDKRTCPTKLTGVDKRLTVLLK